MYILYNNDGSVKAIKLTDFIQKGNDGVNSIFLAIDGRDNTEWSASVLFTLPDDSKVPLTPVAKTQYVNDIEYKGWEITISSAVTIFCGLVKFSINIINIDSQVLFTYENKLTINPSVIVPNETTITYAQYQALLQYIISIIGNDETNRLPKKRVIGLFNTSDFAIESGNTYYSIDVNLDQNGGFLEDSDLLIITWGNSFAICPIPTSGKAYSVGNLVGANGITKIIKVGYELKSNNTVLTISLDGSFIPPADYTGIVVNYKIAFN